MFASHELPYFSTHLFLDKCHVLSGYLILYDLILVKWLFQSLKCDFDWKFFDSESVKTNYIFSLEVLIDFYDNVKRREMGRVSDALTQKE